MLTKIEYSLVKHLDFAYYIKLFLLFTALYYFNVFFWGLTDPKNYYSSFIDSNLNYIDWLGASILYNAKLLANLSGFNAQVIPPQRIETVEGAYVILSFSCLGLGISSFWTAFVIAYGGSWQRQLGWCLGGILFIWFINCCRIALLLMALDQNWGGLRSMDHHDLFNLIAYLSIVALMYLYTINSTAKPGI